MLFFSIILIVPLFITLGAFLLSKKICVKELCVMISVQFIVALTSAFICYFSAVDDTEVLNGYVTGKEQKEVSCEHSYQCNCYKDCSRDSQGRETCVEHCSTCYDHSHDYDWNVYTSIERVITIDRIDRQGVNEPERWSIVKIDDPISIEHTFENYIKASPDSLFKRTGQIKKFKAQNLLPNYPRVYDYYHINRIFQLNGARIENVDLWQSDLEILNSNIGAKKQANIYFVFATDLNRDYYYALQEHWLGGKKNDIIVLFGLAGSDFEWIEIMAWSIDPMFQVKLRDTLLEIKSVHERKRIIEAIDVITWEYYKRKPMKDFEYLKSSITPSVNQWITTCLIGLFISVIMSIFFHKNEVFYAYRKKYAYQY